VDNGCSIVAKAGKKMMLKVPRKKSKEPKDSEVDNGCSTLTKWGRK
jgi:hypothetical protein